MPALNATTRMSSFQVFAPRLAAAAWGFPALVFAAWAAWPAVPQSARHSMLPMFFSDPEPAAAESEADGEKN